MTVLTEGRIVSVVRAAEAVLSQRAGSSVVLDDPEDLGGRGRTTVVRVRVAQNPFSQARTLVIKALPVDEEPHAFHREIAAYKYATTLPTQSRPGPQIIASDADARVLVLSDLGHGRSMSELLTGRDVTEAVHAVSAWGQALGRMHAATFGGESDFRALLRRGSNRAEEVNVLREQAVRAFSLFDGALRALDVPVPPRVTGMLANACDLFTEGEHRAFSTSDIGPENILINGGGVQFMDYEWGGFRDAILDVAYSQVTCSSALSTIDPAVRERLEEAMVDAWRAEVSLIWPALSNRRVLARRLLAARLLWVWLSTVWMLPLDGLQPTVADIVEAGFAETSELTVAGASSSRANGHLHDLALYTSDPRVLVTRWADLASAASRADDAVLSATAVRLGAALTRDWLT
ncbi:hypothetical protein GII30_12710 [Gordonia amarae]|uniref:Uncharacterized protein n=1 Tax=Gordonia amarae TaxID=36821 RepID=A0A857KYV5_9ACTN|nr:hypothetical protein [Gordonia amarae]QHN17755.1 hypothetical protein GII35_12920 [Gordonia amarae]QHN22285.1 hypothetical protein GII34_12715 [Gordonia amarae]QHN31161.1 hypothetical protein GII32_12875 [Gordonia amarae]QHN39907.1 hypothetical protein GII30_12710 [Gordonia amarae]